MTTIVVDRKKKKIYADSKLSYGREFNKTIKIFHETLHDGEEVLLAICGLFSSGVILKDYLINEGYPDPNKKLVPNFRKEDKNDAFELIILYKNKRLINYTGSMIPFEVIDDYYFSGSGGVIAKAVITYQLENKIKVDIPEAIRIASMLDSGTNDEVYVVGFGK